ncbi:MAG: DNA alkylation repair protein [Bacteroidota bacterium]|nr:DNA alkylation repair protein [Bacteroidota bacterium]MDP3144299.1 DNA alkylation repair protein [Bacteroidota bacterium]
MEPLKEMFNKNYYLHFAQEMQKVYKNFNPEKFVKDVTLNFESLSLNERMRNTSITLKKHLPDDYKKTILILSDVITRTNSNYTNLVFPDYVGLFGHDDFTTSLNALKHFTQFGSSEFAIREFLRRDFNKTIKVMNIWAKDKNAHVRRLASEGSRPRLPWSFKLDEVIKNPKSTQSILEILKADEELYVKKSVANHLNDISKDNTQHMIQLIKSWDKTNLHTAWIVKHASRTLIKKGNTQSLAIFDFEKNPKLKLEKFKIIKPKLKLGEHLEFEFSLTSEKNTSQKLVIDYIIHYQKKGAELSPKVFKLKEITLKPKEKISISKKQVLKDFSTRKHFSGLHYLEIQVNGKVLSKQPFHLNV